MTQFPKAFIFDLDGVITDTAELHYEAWKKLADQLGITIDREFNEQLKGISRMESLELILAQDPKLKDMSQDDKERYATQKNNHYKDLLKTINPTDILPGIKDLLEAIKNNNIKIGLGSASKNAPAVLEQLELTNYFDYLVDAGKVSKGKPDPETFTTAAEGLEVAFEDCVGIEDATAGIEALNKANMFSVGVGSKDQLSEADYIVDSTTGLNFDKIVKRYGEWKQ